MKRIISIMLAAVTFMCLVSCDMFNSKENHNSTNESTGETNNVKSDVSSILAGLEDVDVSSKKFDPHAQIEKTVLVDNSDVKITALKIYTKFDSFCVDFTFENKADKILTLGWDKRLLSCSSINGFGIDQEMSDCHAATGEIKECTMKFDIDSLILRGITEVADIQLEFMVRDNDFNYTILPPADLKTSIADSHDYSVDYYQKKVESANLKDETGLSAEQFTANEIFNQNGIRIISQMLVTDEYGQKKAYLEVENSTDNVAYLEANMQYVNGLAVDSQTTGTCVAGSGKRSLLIVNLMGQVIPSVYNKYGISDISNISFDLNIYEDREGKPTKLGKVYAELSDENSSYDKTGDELYSKNDLSIVNKSLDYDEDTGTCHIYMLALNNSDKSVIIRKADNILMNGSMCGSDQHDTCLEPGESGVIDVTVSKDNLDRRGVASLSDIKNIDVKLFVIDEENRELDKPEFTVNY